MQSIKRTEEYLDSDIEQAVDFLIKYSTYKESIRDMLRAAILDHINYRSCFMLFDNDNRICGFCRWNIAVDGRFADILDCVIREDFRNQDLMRRMLQEGLKRFPAVEYLRFERGYDDCTKIKPKHIWMVERFMRRRA